MIKLSRQKLGIPLMILSDNPSLPGGLSRMGRDLATLCATLPNFRVGYLGRGIGNRVKLPITLYDYPESGQWGEAYLQDAWEDFCQGHDGIVISLDDLSRRHWLVNTTGLPDRLATFLGPGRNFQLWSYIPLDSTGPNGRTLSVAATDCVLRYDRVLAASEWGRDVLRASGRSDADWLPHGLWIDKFHSIPDAKRILDWRDKVVVGCVMANQSRKDYPAAFECFATLKAHYGNRFKGWLHTDALIHYWNIYALAADYGVGDCLEASLNLDDSALAVRYSACDCCILPTAGEGFGFPIAESLACGTATITTDYAGGQELVEDLCRIPPVAYRVDTQHNVLRAVLSGYAFAQAAQGQIEARLLDPEYRSNQLAESVKHLSWTSLKHLWTRWLLEGLR